MTTRVVLDTSAYSWLRRGHAGLIDLVTRASIVCLPLTVLGELEASFFLGNRQRENLTVLEEFLAEPFVDFLPMTRDTARLYGLLFGALRRNGTPIPTNDIWIAAAVQCSGAHLITFDADFELVPDLSLTLLTPST